MPIGCLRAAPSLGETTNLGEGFTFGCGKQEGPLSCGLSEVEICMRPNILFAALLGTIVLAPDQQAALAQGITLDTAAIEQATGLKGQLIPEENVFKVTKPRTDVKIAVDQWTMPPFMGLGSWHDGRHGRLRG